MFETFRTQLTTIRSACSMADVLHALQVGSVALANIQERTPLHEVADTLSEIEDTLATQRELDSVISQRLVGFSVDDDEELLKELATLAEEMEDLPSPLTDIIFPSVPNTVIPIPSSSQPSSSLSDSSSRIREPTFAS